ncbi:MAG TPA: methionine--tRNA ligase subunit beta, partial [Desulfurivibrionaceae bacterium]|nr:methionine--tRNA ligase subunit beta [Desulfurivibrionaceae bacterium]
GPDFAELWGGAEHIIAKDILKPHAIYWPTMLRSLGLAPFRRLHVHGYWNINETKMSKSLGNVVRPADLVAQFGADATRYFLLREMTFGLDSSYSPETLLTRQNTDLANDLGNLFSRSLTMVKNFCESKVPPAGQLADGDREMRDAALAMVSEYREQMNGFAFNRALQAVWKVISLANKYIVTNAPWELAKQPDQRERLETVLNTLLESLRLITLTMHPVMPGTAGKMAVALGITSAPDLNSQGVWGLLPVGSGVNPGESLFPRLEMKKPGTPPAPAKKVKPPQAPTTGATEPALATADAEDLISYEQFQKLDLRVAEIVAAERVAKSDRLLKLTVLAPEERTIVAGIAAHYAPEELIGKQVIIVANLKPVKLMGIASHGMVLAAKDGERLVVSALAGPMPAGSKVA